VTGHVKRGRMEVEEFWSGGSGFFVCLFFHLKVFQLVRYERGFLMMFILFCNLEFVLRSTVLSLVGQHIPISRSGICKLILIIPRDFT